MLGNSMKTMLNLPSTYTQCIYGYKKQTLNRIKKRTNTGIIQTTTTGAMRQFEVTGHPKNIEAAFLMIEEIIYEKFGIKVDLRSGKRVLFSMNVRTPRVHTPTVCNGSEYRKVASSRLSRLVAHFWIFRLLMKGKFDAYVLKLNSRPVYCS